MLQLPFLLMLMFLAIQQLIVASSSLWIILLINNIQTGSNFVIPLFLYLTSLVLPYIPGNIAVIYLEKWKYSMILNLSENFKATSQSNQAMWADKESKDTCLSVLSTEGITAISNFSDYVYALISTATNVLFNIFTLSILITWGLGISYCISLIAVAILMKFQKKYQEYLSDNAQEARISFFKTLLDSWDNIVLGNRYNLLLWEKNSKSASSSYFNRHLNAEKFKQWFSILIAFLTFVPSFIVVILMLFENQSEPLILGAITVTLPRLFMILNFTYELLSLLFYWPSQKKIICNVRSAIGQVKSYPSLSLRINWDKISYSTNHGEVKKDYPLLNFQEIINKSEYACRITIRGENGSGKTTILLGIKNILQDQAFYLPVKHQLTFQNKISTHSSGESMRILLEEIKNHVEEKIILLDEWDANLDHKNQNHLSNLIDEIAKTRCVIEVRHRL